MAQTLQKLSLVRSAKQVFVQITFRQKASARSPVSNPHRFHRLAVRKTFHRLKVGKKALGISAAVIPVPSALIKCFIHFCPPGPAGSDPLLRECSACSSCFDAHGGSGVLRCPAESWDTAALASRSSIVPVYSPHPCRSR